MAQIEYKSTASVITSNIDNLTETITDLDKQIDKQAQRHDEYVTLNESHIAEINKLIDKTSESIQELKERVRTNELCIKILCVGLFLAGIGLLALTCHVLTM